MLTLDAHCAKHVIVDRRGKGAGFPGIGNLLSCRDDKRRFHGGGHEAVAKLVQEPNSLDD